MFTGLVRTVGRIAALQAGPEARRLVIESDLPASELGLGASVCCSGVCLTVVASASGRFEVDVAFETLRLTTLGSLGVGAAINLEPSLRVGDAVGGHFVSGHVDGLATLRSSAPRGTARELWFDVPEPLLAFVAPKGSICLDGTSLTVNDVDARGAMVGIIPHTLEVTTLGALVPGARVNLEVDLLARYVARALDVGRRSGGVTIDMLADAGYPGVPPKGTP